VNSQGSEGSIKELSEAKAQIKVKRVCIEEGTVGSSNTNIPIRNLIQLGV